MTKDTYFLSIIFNNDNKNSKQLLHLSKLKEDFIKGVYLTLYDETNFPHISDLTIISDMLVNDCLKDNILRTRSRYDYDSDDEYKNVNEYKFDYKRNAKENNIKWRKYVKDYSRSKIKIPTKHYVASVHVNEVNYIVQFDSIDFLNGFQTICSWFYKRNYSICIHLYEVFDSWKICNKVVSYPLPKETKTRLDIITVIIDTYLPNVIAILVLQYCNQCNKIAKDGIFTSSCNTLCLDNTNNTCHYHAGKMDCIKLEHCLADVELHIVK